MRRSEGVKKVVLVRCIECNHSTCFRRGNNPVISICGVRKEFGEAYRMVANATHSCGEYVRFDGLIKNVEQMK